MTASQRRLRDDPLPMGDWLVCLGLASVVLWAEEAKQLLASLYARPGTC